MRCHGAPWLLPGNLFWSAGDVPGDTFWLPWLPQVVGGYGTIGRVSLGLFQPTSWAGFSLNTWLIRKDFPGVRIKPNFTVPTIWFNVRSYCTFSSNMKILFSDYNSTSWCNYCLCRFGIIFERPKHTTLRCAFLWFTGVNPRRSVHNKAGHLHNVRPFIYEVLTTLTIAAHWENVIEVNDHRFEVLR